jgi:glutamine amidotransferase
MPERVAIVDYGMGNLFSVQQACARVGLEAEITSSAEAIAGASGVILPGVGAFGVAMESLRALQLDQTLRQAASSGTPFFGICLGMQLLMNESFEFGRHEGLGIVPGEVVRFEPGADGMAQVKVPQVGWNRIRQPAAPVAVREVRPARKPAQGKTPAKPAGRLWDGTGLSGIEDGAYMYFVHSFFVRPRDPNCILSVSFYGGMKFCSSLAVNNVFATQFHPERSGPRGLRIYQNFAARVRAPREIQHV